MVGNGRHLHRIAVHPFRVIRTHRPSNRRRRKVRRPCQRWHQGAHAKSPKPCLEEATARFGKLADTPTGGTTSGFQRSFRAQGELGRDWVEGGGHNVGCYFTALSADGKTVAWGGAAEKDQKLTDTTVRQRP